MLDRGTFTLPRLNAHRVVLAAAALTTLVAAALATTLVVLSGQALPRAVHQRLTAASGTAMIVAGPITNTDATGYSAAVRANVTAALAGAPSTFYQAYWSDPLGLPAKNGKLIPIAEAAAFDGVTSHAHLLAGTWPAAPVPGAPIPAALPATAAALLHTAPGDVLRLYDRVSNSEVSFLVTGLFRATPGTYWSLNLIAASGSSTAGTFVTYGPLVVNPAAFPGRLAIFEGSWVDQPDMTAIPLGRFGTIAAHVSALGRTSAAISGLALSTSLDSVLVGTATSLGVSRSLLAIAAVELLLLTGAALVAVALLLAAQREGEYAMLAARGASRLQRIRMAMAEAVPLCLLAGACGAAAGVWLAGRFAGRGAGTLVGGWWAAAVVAAGAAVILVAPAALAPTPGAARVRQGRAAVISGVSRAGADVAVLALAVLAGWQLRRYSVASAGPDGTTGIDPVLALAPALALAGGTIAALRVLPAAGKAGDRLAARGRRLTAAMASWQVSRQPFRQGGTVLLIVLAVATGTLALAQHQSWVRSNQDQAAFAAGADVRADLSQPLTAAQASRLATVPTVRGAMPVVVVPSATNAGSSLLALDADQAARIALVRPDQSPLPAAMLFRKILPGGRPGVRLGGQTAEIRFTAAFGPAGLNLAAAAVTITIDDADGDGYQLAIGTLPADGRPHTLNVRVAPAGRHVLGPLRVTAIAVDYQLPTIRPQTPATFRVLSVNSAAGTAVSGFTAAVSAPELSALSQSNAVAGNYSPPQLISSGPGAGATWTTTFDPGFGTAAAAGPQQPATSVPGELDLTVPSRATATIPGLATRAFLAANNLSVGDTAAVAVGGGALSVTLVAVVSTFPTVTSGDGAVIVDLPSVQDGLASQSMAPLPVTEWWLSSAGHQVPPRLPGVLPPGSAVTSAAGLAAGLAADPMSAVPQQALLAMAIAAAALAISGCCVAIAVGVRQRRTESALLAALGVDPGGAARQLCLERLMLGLPAALAGLALGAVIAELLVPAVTLTATARQPVPPVIIQFDWAQTLPLALAVATLPVLVAAAVIARRPDPAAELRTAESA
jgi:hypothetical protein